MWLAYKQTNRNMVGLLIFYVRQPARAYWFVGHVLLNAKYQPLGD